jgi:putative transposase
VDSYKTELIADRVWVSRAQVDLATVAYIGWFNNDRLRSALGDIPPLEFELEHALALTPALCSADPAETALRAAPARPRR